VRAVGHEDGDSGQLPVGRRRQGPARDGRLLPGGRRPHPGDRRRVEGQEEEEEEGGGGGGGGELENNSVCVQEVWSCDILKLERERERGGRRRREGGGVKSDSVLELEALLYF